MVVSTEKRLWPNYKSNLRCTFIEINAHNRDLHNRYFAAY